LVKLSARLDERRQSQFGDFVALLSSSVTESMGRNVEMNSGNVTLFAVKGDHWLANQYVLFLPANSRAGVQVVLSSRPEGWPTPDVKQLLPVLHTAPPQVYWIMDGDNGWRGGLNDKTLSMLPVSASVDRELLSLQTLGAQLWTANDVVGAPAHNVEAKLQEGLLRLRSKGLTTIMKNGSNSLADGLVGTYESTAILDPAKNDLATMRYTNIIRNDSLELYQQTRNHYLSFAQLPNGQWYPTAWNQEISQRDTESGSDNTTVTTYHLQIIPGLKLEDDWFTNPVPRVTTGAAR